MFNPYTSRNFRAQTSLKLYSSGGINRVRHSDAIPQVVQSHHRGSNPWSYTLHPTPQTLHHRRVQGVESRVRTSVNSQRHFNPKPKTRNPKPGIRNLRENLSRLFSVVVVGEFNAGHPSTLNLQLSILNPQPSTLNPQSSTLSPSTLNPQPSIQHPQPSILNPKPYARNPQQ